MTEKLFEALTLKGKGARDPALVKLLKAQEGTNSEPKIETAEYSLGNVRNIPIQVFDIQIEMPETETVGALVSRSPSYVIYTFNRQDIFIMHKQVGGIVLNTEEKIKDIVISERKLGTILVLVFESKKALFYKLTLNGNKVEYKDVYAINENVESVKTNEFSIFVISRSPYYSVHSINTDTFDKELLIDKIPEENQFDFFASRDDLFYSKNGEIFEINQTPTGIKGNKIFRFGNYWVVEEEETQSECVVTLYDLTYRFTDRIRINKQGKPIYVVTNDIFIFYSGVAINWYSVKKHAFSPLKITLLNNTPLSLAIDRDVSCIIVITLTRIIKKNKIPQKNIKCENIGDKESLSDVTKKESKSVGKERDWDKLVSESDSKPNNLFKPKKSFSISNDNLFNSLCTDDKILIGVNSPSVLNTETEYKAQMHPLGIQNLFDNLYHRLEMERNEREKKERIRQDLLLDKISESLNKNLTFVVESVVKKEMDILKKGLFDSILKFNKQMLNENKEIVMDSLRSMMIDTAVPAIESCMEEMKIQMLGEVKMLNCRQYELSNADDGESIILNLLEEEKLEEAVMLALEDDELMDILVEKVDAESLETLDGRVLLKLLERSINTINSNCDWQENYFNFIRGIIMAIDSNEFSDAECNQLITYIQSINDIMSISGIDDHTLRYAMKVHMKCVDKRRNIRRNNKF
ncbi:hypothetical protein TCON_1666 [Astathelohania contejeani]|uniref:Uncharacterized protein n=1 Tax=Astathelohania contejeani TaxID=164912 RepID=A0ABQ7HY96_9MICR|nr:hypothetical protein TCON_1666 [Thelohania contejeani]